jgi:hypothetical protein
MMRRRVLEEEGVWYCVPYVLRECIDLGKTVRILNRTEGKWVNEELRISVFH